MEKQIRSGYPLLCQTTRGDRMAKTKSITKKAALLQAHQTDRREKQMDEDALNEMVQQEIKQNLESYYRENAPWVLENMTVSQWYDERIRPLQT